MLSRVLWRRCIWTKQQHWHGEATVMMHCDQQRRLRPLQQQPLMLPRSSLAEQVSWVCSN